MVNREAIRTYAADWMRKHRNETAEDLRAALEWRRGLPSTPRAGQTQPSRARLDPHVIEAQLAHSVRDSLGRAYNRTEFLEQRRKMLQAWADYLDKLRRGAPVVQIDRRKQ